MDFPLDVFKFSDEPSQPLLAKSKSSPSSPRKPKSQTLKPAKSLPSPKRPPYPNDNQVTRQCFVCEKSLPNVSVQEFEQHVNDCLDNTDTAPAHSTIAAPVTIAAADDADAPQLTLCQLCHKDLSAMTVALRAQHINRCCDSLEQQVWRATPCALDFFGRLDMLARTCSVSGLFIFSIPP